MRKPRCTQSSDRSVRIARLHCRIKAAARVPTKEATKGDGQERAGPTVLTKDTTKMAERERASEQCRCRNHKRAR